MSSFLKHTPTQYVLHTQKHTHTDLGLCTVRACLFILNRQEGPAKKRRLVAMCNAGQGQKKNNPTHTHTHTHWERREGGRDKKHSLGCSCCMLPYIGRQCLFEKAWVCDCACLVGRLYCATGRLRSCYVNWHDLCFAMLCQSVNFLAGPRRL